MQPFQPASNRDEVIGLYRNVLGREPSEAEVARYEQLGWSGPYLDQMFRQGAAQELASRPAPVETVEDAPAPTAPAGMPADQAASTAMDYWQNILGRSPRPNEEGFGYYSGQLESGADPNDVQAYLRMVRDLGERPVVPGFGRSQEMARVAVAGMNRQPGVFSDYTGMMGGDAMGRQPASYNAGNVSQMQPADMNQWQATAMKNPLLANETPAPAAQNPVLGDQATNPQNKLVDQTHTFDTQRGDPREGMMFGRYMDTEGNLVLK
jgi:hypothetical protein